LSLHEWLVICSFQGMAPPLKHIVHEFYIAGVVSQYKVCNRKFWDQW
jgi:hypothetical protein